MGLFTYTIYKFPLASLIEFLLLTTETILNECHIHVYLCVLGGQVMRERDKNLHLGHT